VNRDPLRPLAELEGVPSGMAAARDAVDALLRDRGLRRSGADVTAESLLRGASASARLEGSDYDVDQLRRGAGDLTAQAALRLAGRGLGVLPAWRSATVQGLARLHTIAAAGTLPADRLGRPVSVEAAKRLAGLARTVAASRRADEPVPGMVLAAIVHAEVATAGAFASHNGLIARLATRLVLIERAVDPASVTVPEAGHVALRDEYVLGLAAYASGEPDGVHQWLLHCTRAFAAGAEAAADLVGR
jgi:hypothetical protein